jgi:lipid-A-disaccharide synthase
MLKQLKHFPDYEFVVAAAPNLALENYHAIEGMDKIKMVTGKTYELLHHAHAGLIKSGTSTLEAALFNLPEVCCYAGNPISVWIAKRLAIVKYVSLPNLILDKLVVKELIQKEMNETRMKQELNELINEGEARTNMLTEFAKLKSMLGTKGASARIAQKLHTYVKNQKN